MLAAFAVHPYPDGVLAVGVHLQPGPPTGNHFGAVKEGVGVLVQRVRLKYTPGRTDQLRDDHPLRAVDDEHPLGRHHREVSQIDLLFLDLPGVAVQEATGDRERTSVCLVLGLAGPPQSNGRISEGVVGQHQDQLAGDVFDGGDFLEDFIDSLVKEPVERVSLYGY